MNEPVVTVTVDQLIAIIGQKEVERVIALQMLTAANARIADLEKQVQNPPPKE